MNTYTCALCNGVFEMGQSEDECKEELFKEFPGVLPEHCNLVCDDCYPKILDWRRNGTQAADKSCD